MSITPRQRAAYLRTAYRAGTRAEARIGRRSSSVGAVLKKLRVRQGGFVTAQNPFSRPMPPGWNERALTRLRAAARRLPMVEGEGVFRRWRERHLLIGGDPRRLAVLARRFLQNAVVVVRIGAPARLKELC
jgi:hypothetical protein